jgi:ATP-dependent Clp protease ATP-binding subunit ClpC
MNHDLLQLVQNAKNNPDAFWPLVDALRLASSGDPFLLVTFARSPHKIERKAAAAACGGQTDHAVVDALLKLAADPEYDVRQEFGYNLKNWSSWVEMDPAVETLLRDFDINIRQNAAWAAQHRERVHPALIQRLTDEADPWVRSEIGHVLGGCSALSTLVPLLSQLAKDSDVGVQQACAGAIERHLNLLGKFPGKLARPASKTLHDVRQKVNALTYGTYTALKNWLGAELVQYVDLDSLAEFGAVMTAEAEAGKLPRGYGFDEQIETVLHVLDGSPPRAVVLLGDSGTGKTALVQELAHRLKERPEPGHVLRMTPQDFLVNTRYIGEWETRVRNIVNAVKPPRRIVLYIPNIEELAWMGTWSKSDANVATAMAPFIERGDLTIIGESTVEGFRKGLGANRSLRRLFHAIELQPADQARTLTILRAVAQEAGVNVPDEMLTRVNELAMYFGSGSVQPGRSVGLLRKVLGLNEDKPGPISDKDILATLSSSTGIPADFLDDSVALNRTDVRQFFEARVMGQPEAVEAVVDLVTLVKAGLNDPNKPFGVFLFIGPTGVGKTELARALAEHLFCDVDRLVRLDMSEYATYEAYERLIGNVARNEAGLLTSTVRERPFAVILLDEIEKAHPNVYNLCLQIFDAGRLTDGMGRTVDFRRTIIILTSNVGSTVQTGPALGLAREPPPLPTRETILRDLNRWFRPEFLNRLDRIVTFRPLATETAERIAQREIARVLERAGITRRHLAVDVDPGVLPLLLREGYSQAFGARPLKRTVERLVLLPMARAIAEGKVPAGSLVRLVAKHDRVEIDVEPPEPATETAPPPAKRAGPVEERAAQLVQQAVELVGQATPLAARKSELLAQSATPGFWDDQANSRRVMDEVYRLDGILTSLAELEKKLRGEIERIGRHRHSERDVARIDAFLDGHEAQLNHLGFLVQCRDSQALGDAIVTLRLATKQGGGLDGVALLARMYRNLAQRRGLEVTVLDDRLGGDPPEDTISLLVYGPGAYALLANEAGEHQLSKGPATKEKKRPEPAGKTERDVVRIEVLPAPTIEPNFQTGELDVVVRPLAGTRGRLLSHLNHEVRLFHTKSMVSVRGWCEGAKVEAISRMKMLLSARLAAQSQPAPERPPVVRRYRLGPSQLVRDQRTGRSTGRLDQVLEGHLDMFLLPPAGG